MRNLRGAGLDLELYDPFYIQTDSIQYAEMMDGLSTVTIMSSHMGEEVGISFIEADTNFFEAKYSRANGQGMYKVDLDSIQPNIPVEMDMYIHMPSNNKFIKYISEGGIVDEEQIRRLKENKIDNFCVEDSHIRTWRAQAASEYLNSRFKKKAKKKGKAS